MPGSAADAKELVVAGMMTHMCVDATVRQVADLGYRVSLLGDACATGAQSYNGETIPARQVHTAFLAALNGFYAKVISAREL
jgi:nicotinamidase-related amidase